MRNHFRRQFERSVRAARARYAMPGGPSGTVRLDGPVGRRRACRLTRHVNN
jgi:hypothetical protein